MHKKSQTTGIALATVDVGASDVGDRFNITSMPTFAVVKWKASNVLMTKVGGAEGTVDEVFDCALKNK